MEDWGITNKMQQSKETIKSWLMSRDYPKEFLHFFFHWTLLNLHYNELSQKRDEVDRVLEFGRKYEKLFDIVKDDAIDLIKNECVGKGKEAASPSSWIKAASLQLRSALNIETKSVCADCRKEKSEECKNIEAKEYSFGKMEALMRVLYEVRCNLFHGDKTEYKNGPQVERNLFLVSMGNKILEKVLSSIVKN